MTPRRSLAVLAVALALCAGCATSGATGFKRLALANEAVAVSLQRVQLAADQLEAGGSITKAQRDALSPYIVRLATGGKALNAAILAADVPTTRAQVIGVLTVLGELTTAADSLPPSAKVALLVAIEATRAAVIVISAGV